MNQQQQLWNRSQGDPHEEQTADRWGANHIGRSNYRTEQDVGDETAEEAEASDAGIPDLETQQHLQYGNGTPKFVSSHKTESSTSAIVTTTPGPNLDDGNVQPTISRERAGEHRRIETRTDIEAQDTGRRNKANTIRQQIPPKQRSLKQPVQDRGYKHPQTRTRAFAPKWSSADTSKRNGTFARFGDTQNTN